ncbi:hypothetical protein [Acetanaerobacterium elongatum]|uniref:ABC-2 type transport system permease protein n=1 Tax=Acetanaerobacterium elongatum TaxID=258515 RepID=A0A1H0CNG6_9FIRM|nr:hypothetical protein [Acetanaerobacterium elongatum]SDN59456.1 hypothetical protein SAMN05192585_12415 [Acetanaerobacterium elongatum]
MTSARSWTNRRGLGLYLHTVKGHIGLMVAFFLLLTLTGPLPYTISSLSVLAQMRNGGLIGASSGSIYASQYPQENLFAFLIITLIGSLVIGLITTAYMHNRSAMDLYGALPIKRQHLLLSKALAGVTVILIPYILSTSLLFVAQGVLQAYKVDTLQWMISFGSFAVYAIGVYIICVFSAVTTGAVFDTAVFTLALCGAPSIILLLDRMFTQIALIGYQTADDMNTIILGLSPVASSVARLFDNSVIGQNSYVIRSFIIWPIAIALLAWAALALYQRRRTEIAGTSKPSGVLQIIMKLMAANIAGILTAALFAETLNNTWPMATAGFLIGAFVAYFVAEAVLARGFKTFKKMLLQFAAVAAVILTFTGILYTGAFGYSGYVPKEDEVKDVNISYNGAAEFMYKFFPTADWQDTGFTEPEVIRQVILAHQAITTSQQFGRLNLNRNNPSASADGILNTSTQITYTLKNGQTVKRLFSATPVEAREKIYALNGLAAFRAKTNIASYLKPEDIISVTRSDFTFAQEQPITRLNKEQATELLKALKDDEAAQSFEQVMSPPSRELFTMVLNYTVTYTDTEGGKHQELQTGNVAIAPWYKNTIAALRNIGWDITEVPDYSAVTGAYILQPEVNLWRYWESYASEQTGGQVSTTDGLLPTSELYQQALYSKDQYYKEYGTVPITDGQTYDANMLDYYLKGRITDKAQIEALANACVKRYLAQPGERIYTVAFEAPVSSLPSVNNGISSNMMIFLLPESKAPAFINELPFLNFEKNQTAGTTVAQSTGTEYLTPEQKEKAFQQMVEAQKN